MKITRNNISEHLFEYQLKLIDRSVKEAASTHDWKTQWQISEKQMNDFVAYAIPLIKKTFKCNKTKAEAILYWFLVNFGLKTY
jgi:hypothetical protein